MCGVRNPCPAWLACPAVRRTDFSYDLPPDRIAQAPLPERSASRLLCLDPRTGEMADRRFSDLAGLLHAGDLLVLNDTRVIPARLLGRKDTGGAVEVLVERRSRHAAGEVMGRTRSYKPVNFPSSARPGALVAVELLEATSTSFRGREAG